MSTTECDVSLQVVRSGASAFVTVCGELDLSTAPVLEDALEPLLGPGARPPLRHLVLDLAGVTFADVVGLTPVLRAAETMAESGGGLQIRGERPPVRQLLRLLQPSAVACPGGTRRWGRRPGRGTIPTQQCNEFVLAPRRSSSGTARRASIP